MRERIGQYKTQRLNKYILKKSAYPWSVRALIAQIVCTTL